MLQALLHNKLQAWLTRDPYDIEDVLTSVVIGSSLYLPPEQALLPFLSKARAVNGDLLGEHLKQVDRIEAKFWPSWAALKATPAAPTAGEAQNPIARAGQPEVLLVFHRRDRRPGWLLLEAKLHYGKSARPSDGPAVTDQLGKYWLHLRERAASVGAEPLGVVYITKGLSVPASEFAETQGELSEKGHQSAPLFWLSWRFFVNSLPHTNSPALLRDVVCLLRDGWGMVQVEMTDWPAPPSVLPTWELRTFQPVALPTPPRWPAPQLVPGVPPRSVEWTPATPPSPSSIPGETSK